VGYAGGSTADPTYRNIGDHTETLQVDYDPSVVTYEDLLAVFWEVHQPDRRSWSRQYMSAIFTHDDEQQRLATESMQQTARRLGKTLYTRILPFTGFTLAEDYHQKYYLRGAHDIYREIQARYDSPQAITDATAAARINGFLGGYGSREDVAAVQDALQLSPGSARRLTDSAGSANR
jgi:peptide-methionine (S)-S-oxide reductase